MLKHSPFMLDLGFLQGFTYKPIYLYLLYYIQGNFKLQTSHEVICSLKFTHYLHNAFFSFLIFHKIRKSRPSAQSGRSKRHGGSYSP